MLVNMLLLAALLNLGMGHVSRRTESPALTVLSLALLKGVEQGQDEGDMPPPTRADTPPPPAEPLPVSQPSMTTAVTPQIVMDQSSSSTIVPVHSTAPVASPAMSALLPAQLEVAATSAAAAPPRRGAADGLNVKAPPGSSRSYAAKVRSWLYAHKIYPRRARMRREEGRVQVRFILDRAGTLLEGAVIQGSGNAALDEEARAMLRRASPYPRAPAELAGERIEFTAPIEFILPA